MIGLFVDTASKNGLALLVKADQVLAQEIFISNSGVFEPIKKLFANAKLNPEDLDFVAAGKGPGSFTGIRVSQMAIRSMAFALRVPFYGLSSLSLYTQAYPVALDARSGGVWIQEPGLEPKRVSLELLKAYPKIASPDPEPLIDRLGQEKVVSTAFDPENIVRLLSEELLKPGSQDPEILYL
ncbi:MAG: tRNA (adenosine(37)-N6)-threonylcarbamoyltransferase complex dimerization subunit type 1 TsaB [Chlamydiia bacterium]|nr:tRNA (adenosine(37)-N6)-threonylcarbamoyltransferase complex dimerization subunit type 1 TsaB [Chlamydiia bacterium]